MKLALGRLFEHCHEVLGALPVARVHDEIVAAALLADAGRATQWLAHHMTAAMRDIVDDRVSIEIETTVGKDWAGTPLEDWSVSPPLLLPS